MSNPHQFTMKIEAKADVLDIVQGKLMSALTPSDIVPGQQYVVSVKSDAKYAGGSLPVKKVALYNTTNENPKGWFYIVEEGSPVTITAGRSGTQHSKVYAFFVDITSQDNTGGAELTFAPVC